MFSDSPALRLGSCAGLLALVLPAARACGPDFPNAYLVAPAGEIAALPTLSFAAELSRLLPGRLSPVAPSPAPAEPAELAEVRAALATVPLGRADLAAAVAAYSRENPPPALPREFQLYARGARAWHAGRRDDAVAAWRELLALPAAARHFRTTWAAYMVGRALWDSDGPAATAMLQATRSAVKDGFADSQDLATASLGWEARVHFQQADYPGALRLYFQQFAAGDSSAANSLQLTAQKLFPEPATDEAAAAGAPACLDRQVVAVAGDPELRAVITAWFVARGGPFALWSAKADRQFRRWIRSLPLTGALGAAEADRWAWAAYQNGLWEEAGGFARLAPPTAPASEWVRAMLLLRQGAMEEAAAHLACAAHAFPEDPALGSAWYPADFGLARSDTEDPPAAKLAGVRGVLALQREQYGEALHLFLEAGHWIDASYVAERVLTLDELAALVAAEVPAPPAGAADTNAATRNRDLRHLLARRLVRAGQFDRAREYFSPDVTPLFDHYVSLVRTGYRADCSAAERADALWQAAQIVRESGLELQGTELEPDFAIWEGNYQWPEIARTRGTDGSYDSHYPAFDQPPVGAVTHLLAANWEEITRARKIHPPTKRFHYRQRAAQLAFLSATLLPDDSEQTATELNTAGRWVAAQDPEGADLFYKTLVFRCPHTALGRAAAERRWLVPADGETPPPET